VDAVALPWQHGELYGYGSSAFAGSAKAAGERRGGGVVAA
jgi:hypothetical protein